MTASTGGDRHQDVWVFLEVAGSDLARVSLELVGQGRALAASRGWQLVGVLLGHRVGGLAETALEHGADRLIVADDAALATYNTDAYTAVMHSVVAASAPAVLLLGATHDGRDLAGRLAVRLRTGMTADAVGLSMDPSEGLVALKPAMGGRILAACTCTRSWPQMATVRPGVFPVPPRGAPVPPEMLERRLEHVPVAITAESVRTEIVAQEHRDASRLADAKRVVAVGLGVADHLTEVAQLADALGAELGVTRPLVDQGLADRDRQIGSTGLSVRPDVALVVGASGAMHFASGLANAGTVIAINADPRAPIFEACDYGVVGDAQVVIELLADGLRRTAAGAEDRG